MGFRVDVLCDRCEQFLKHAGVDLDDAWRNAEEFGWAQVKGVILCPDCEEKAALDLEAQVEMNADEGGR